MFNPTQLVIEAFVRELQAMYVHTYSVLEPIYSDVITFIGRAAMENIANSDAPYEQGDSVELAEDATDASMAPYHVSRSNVFVRERFGRAQVVHFDTMAIERNIEHTRFPFPKDETHANTADYPGLVRAADLIGQLADINYLRKIPALFAEFDEIGANKKLGYRSPADLRAKYPDFFWTAVSPYIGDGLRYLSVTQEGKLWISNLYAHVFSQEHCHRLANLRS